MKTYDEELNEFIRDMEGEDYASLYKREAQLPLRDLGPIDDLTEVQFLEYLRRSLSDTASAAMSDNSRLAFVRAMQAYFDVMRRRHNLGPEIDNPDRYNLDNLGDWVKRPGVKE